MAKQGTPPYASASVACYSCQTGPCAAVPDPACKGVTITLPLLDLSNRQTSHAVQLAELVCLLR